MIHCDVSANSEHQTFMVMYKAGLNSSGQSLSQIVSWKHMNILENVGPNDGSSIPNPSLCAKFTIKKKEFMTAISNVFL